MSGDEEDRVYEIEVTYHDSGFSLGFDMDEWRGRIEEDFSSFESIKEFYRTDYDDFERAIGEYAEEVPTDQSYDGPGIVITNAPKGWKEDSERAAPFIRAAEKQMVRMGLFSLIEDEVEAQNDLLDVGRHKPLIIRQSAFFEAYLELQSQLAFQHDRDRPLSTSEMNVIEGMGHTDRIRLAHLLGVITEEEHGHLQSMATRRNELAHNPWSGFDDDEEMNIKTTAIKVLEILEGEINRVYEQIEEDDLGPADDSFDIGFGGLEPGLQLLQLGILDALDSLGGKAPVAKVALILPYDPDDVQQRCLRMDHMEYLALDAEGETATMLEKGEELLEAELRKR